MNSDNRKPPKYQDGWAEYKDDHTGCVSREPTYWIDDVDEYISLGLDQLDEWRWNQP